MLCPKCNTEKEDSEFGNRKRLENNKTGQSWWCKECNVQYGRKKREEYKEKNKNLTYDSTDLTSKVCSKCKTEKPIESFKINRHVASGFNSKCKDCCNQYERERAKKLNPGIRARHDVSIKCYSCKKMLKTSKFNPFKKAKRGYQYWCLDCRDIVKEKRKTRKENRINTDSLMIPTSRPCKKCDKPTVNNRKSRYCNCCAKEIAKERKAKHAASINKDEVKEQYSKLIESDNTKLCKLCTKLRPCKEFSIRYDSYDFLQSYCKDCARELRSNHYQDNKDSYRKRHRAWKKENKVSIKRRHKEAKVAWGDTTAIRLIYKEMRRLNKEAGYVAYHVDHVVPMHHPLVCGLHVENNLQIILATENERKGNSFVPG